MPDNLKMQSNVSGKLLVLLLIIFTCILSAAQIFSERDQFEIFLGAQIILYGFLYFFYKKRYDVTLSNILITAIIARLISAFILPQLSDDVYRFIWDGRLIADGLNPMLTTPDEFIGTGVFNKPDAAYFTKLHSLVNHPQFYTCYPPLMQGIFWVSAFIGGNSINTSVIIIKLILALGDIGAVYLMILILRKLQLDVKWVLLYALNPSVIIEGTGNAHFEVLQVGLMAASIYAMLHQKLKLAAIIWGLAIITKLLPLLLLPLWLKYLGLKKGIIFCLISTLVATVAFLPFVSTESILKFSTSLDLYFRNFEFNASIYYIAREIGWWVKGYNYISFIGPFLMIVFLTIYGVYFFVKRNFDFNAFMIGVLLILSLYYFFATTVHPWYMINLLPFAIFAQRKFAFVWLAAAFLSYITYSNTSFKENFYFIFLEYAIVVSFIIYEWLHFRKRKNVSLSH